MGRKPNPLYTAPNATELARIGLSLDPDQLARLDAVAAGRYGGNRNVAARAALLVGLTVLEDRRTLGLDPDAALVVYCGGLS